MTSILDEFKHEDQPRTLLSQKSRDLLRFLYRQAASRGGKSVSSRAKRGVSRRKRKAGGAIERTEKNDRLTARHYSPSVEINERGPLLPQNRGRPHHAL